MSRLGRIAIRLPKGVEVKMDPSHLVTIKGPKGNLAIAMQKEFSIKIEEGFLHVVNAGEGLSAMHGLYRALLNNHVKGVSEGFEIRLNLIGVGFRANVKGDKLDLQIGLSHPCLVSIPKDVKVVVDAKVNEIIISGINRQEVGQFAATVRSQKRPEPYKGKGIRYKDEYVRKKAGKAAKGKTNG